MAETRYNTVAGFVQFDVEERTAGDQEVRDFLVQAIGSGGSNVRVTVWPEYVDVDIQKGDFVAVQGKFTTETVNGKTYHNISANKLKVWKEDDPTHPAPAPKKRVTKKVAETEEEYDF